MQGPTGPTGPQGPAGVGNLNALSPTTTRGDIIVDNGSGGGSAADVRMGAGTDGQVLAAKAADPLGLHYATITPNTVANNKAIPRYNGTSGLPVPLQDSNLIISDTGAIQSTPTGGNARGGNAVDLQVSRVANTQVASGTSSAILAGSNNTASGANAFVGGGANNTASGTDSTVGAGNTNVASGSDAVIAGGTGNTATTNGCGVFCGTTNNATGIYSTIGGGGLNNASGTYSAVAGGYSNLASGGSAFCAGRQGIASGSMSTTIGWYGKADKIGQVAFAGGRFAAVGDAQLSFMLPRVTTTDGADTELFLDGGITGSLGVARMTVPLNTAWMVTGEMIARDGNANAWFTIQCGIKNNAGTVSLIDAAIVTKVGADAGFLGAAFCGADNVNGSLKIHVTGFAGRTIQWVCHIRAVENAL